MVDGPVQGPHGGAEIGDENGEIVTKPWKGFRFRLSVEGRREEES